jgi:hypothetical protein
MSRVMKALALLRGYRHQSSAARSATSADIAAWIDGMTSRPVEASQELLDKQRSAHLLHTTYTAKRVKCISGSAPDGSAT